MRASFPVVWGILLLIAAPAHAHRLDEYLQATTLSLEKDRVQATVRLIPGVDVFRVVLASIDTDANGAISEAELRAYAERVHRDLSLTVNGERLRFRLMSSMLTNIETLKRGLGEIELQFDADVPRSGPSRKLVFENHHQSAIGTYLVNSLVPSDEDIRITGQNRSYDQSSYELDYVHAGADSLPVLSNSWSAHWEWAATAALFLLAGASVLWRYAIASDAGGKK
jgi:hypothetical protein